MIYFLSVLSVLGILGTVFYSVRCDSLRCDVFNANEELLSLQNYANDRTRYIEQLTITQRQLLDELDSNRQIISEYHRLKAIGAI